jgi:DNA-directed RNA polymerase subunit RPC12/RpoP
MPDSMTGVQCPNCRNSVNPLAPACPECGEKIYVEHPGDIKGVKHDPINLPPATFQAGTKTDSAKPIPGNEKTGDK